MSKKNGLFSSKKFKHGSMAILFTAVFAAAMVLLNVVATALSTRYPLSIDLTANQDFTIVLAEQHDVFVRDIDQDVNIIVCAGEDDIDSGLYANYLSQLYLLVDETNNRYYDQMATFLNDFHKINPHINVTWRNPMSSSEFATLAQKYSSENIQYGDIIVESTVQTADGQSIDRYQIIKLTDLFDQQDKTGYAQYGYGNYTVTGSKLETSLVSAFYVVTSEESIKVAVIGGHSSGDVTGLQNLLKKNNYEFVTVSNLLTDEIPSDAQMVVIYAPTQDFDPSEVAKIDNFLNNGGNLGKDLMYVSSINQPTLPNLEEYLLEWGYHFTNDIVYTTTQGQYNSMPVYVFGEAGNSGYTDMMKYDTSKFTYPVPYRACYLAYEEDGMRTTTSILVSDENSVGMPADADESWKPADAANKGPFALVAMTTEAALIGTAQQRTESHVIVINSDNFLQSGLLENSNVVNGTLTLSIVNDLAGVEAPIEIKSRPIETTTFQDKILGSPMPMVIRIVFVVVLPLLMLVTGLVIYIRRKNL